MAECVAGGFVIAAEEVYIEYVLPRPSAQRARLDLAQADVAQSEDAERLEEGSGEILDLEGDGGLVGAWRNQPLIVGRGSTGSVFSGCGWLRPANQEEAGKVTFVVFDAGLQNSSGVFASRMASGDAGGVGKA